MSTLAHKHRLTELDSLNWRVDASSGQHHIQSEPCVWIDGEINGTKQSAWLSIVTGSVYLHGGPDMPFDAFLNLMKPQPPIARQRGLFD